MIGTFEGVISARQQRLLQGMHERDLMGMVDSPTTLIGLDLRVVGGDGVVASVEGEANIA